MTDHSARTDRSSPRSAPRTPGDDPPARRWPRRAVLAGLAGTGTAAAAAATVRLRPTGDVAGAPPARRAASPLDGGGFADRDESFARSAGATRISAVSAEPALEHPTPSAAAAAPAVTAPTLLDTTDPVLHLLRRTTYGPTPELVAEVHAVGIDAWLEAQLDPMSLPDPADDLVAAALPLAWADPATVRRSIEPRSWEAMSQCSVATMARQMWSTRQLYEVVVELWADHLHVPTPGGVSWDTAPDYQATVIRAHALGRFADMLVASARHPAMLRWLNAAESRKEAVNENYGRELLELHTVGVASGYTEEDVRDSARILTGRTVAGEDGPGEPGSFRYDPAMHWVGPVQVLGFRHDNATAEGGLEVGDAYLRYLAGHEATARTIARKLAVRFVSDDPPASLVDRLAAAYLDNDTAIVPVLRTLFRSSEFWAAVGQKVRRPRENIAAAVRALGIRPERDVSPTLRRLSDATYRTGHQAMRWPAPDGYPDVHAAWRSAGTTVELWNVHRALVGGWDDGLTQPDPLRLVEGRPAGTVGELVDGLCRRLCVQTFRPEHREALVEVLGGDPSAPAPSSPNGDLLEVVALVLDSPYFALR